MEVTITRRADLKSKPDDDSLGFGTLFTDYMFNMDYDLQNGWHTPRIEPYGPIVMDPSTMFLHYGQGVLKASRLTAPNPAGSSCFGPRKTLPA